MEKQQQIKRGGKTVSVEESRLTDEIVILFKPETTTAQKEAIYKLYNLDLVKIYKSTSACLVKVLTGVVDVVKTANRLDKEQCNSNGVLEYAEINLINTHFCQAFKD